MKVPVKITRLLVVTLSLVFISACSLPVSPASPEDIQTSIAQTLTAQPTETIPVTPQATNTPAASPTPYQTPTPTLSPPIPGTISAAFLNLRTGPSTFFDIIQTFVEGTELTALARTADSEWVRVEINFEDDPTMEGWMAALFLELNGNPAALPVDDLPEAQTISGTVRDDEGNPLSGINVAVILQINQEELRADSESDGNGEWLVYIPDDLFGTFDVQIVSWNCESPVANLTSCQLSGYVQAVGRAFVVVPQQEPIDFIYESTSMQLSGTVVDEDEDPAGNFLVVAERDDGARSFGRSDVNGEFSIPITPGVWEVYIIDYDPDYVEGERVSVEVSDSAPDPVILTLPD
jgi:hypothetical protein